MLTLLSAMTPLAPYQIFVITLCIIAGLIAVWFAACCVIAAYILKKAVKPTAHTLAEARAMQEKAEKMDFTDYDCNMRKEEFSLDGVFGKLKGEILFNDETSERCKVAVICHGHTWNRINSLKYARPFLDEGFSVIIYDNTYFGESEGKFCTLGYYEKHDLSKVIDFAREKFGKDSFLALHGESMGAVTVLSVLGLRSDVDAVIADCPFSDAMTYYREVFEHTFRLPSFPVVELANSMAKRKYKYDFKKSVPIEDVKNSDVPVCFIHGKADDFIYPHHSEDMYAASKNPLSELHLVDNAGHARSYRTDNAAYCGIVRNFLKKIENCKTENN